MHTLWGGQQVNTPGTWVSASHLKVLAWILDFRLQPDLALAVVGIWRVSQYVEDLSLSLLLK